ncbi:hypothetical protein KSF_085880 [Reticulibacter mediterranei]|uniref:Uncharacterized protein n=1 Tax=Reticulibacter mediterranei TaxID=2778369 RepID=A0A8J3IU27_9CHLR|nr:hypothetical protein KSF_085880 [Reticulibacter mediterranei]
MLSLRPYAPQLLVPIWEIRPLFVYDYSMQYMRILSKCSILDSIERKGVSLETECFREAALEEGWNILCWNEGECLSNDR